MQYRTLISVLPFVALAHGHGAIIKAEGSSGPASKGFGVDDGIARNCTTISPCQLDSTIIRDAEIKQNIVNSCGRTELAGNIDVGESTENAISAKQVTGVKQGDTIAVTIHQVNADGAGPYACDLDQSSNAGTFETLTVTNNVPGENGLSGAKFQDFVINVQLPATMNCFGGSTGDICTVRCRNNAVAGPFGGCFPIQQTDGTGRTNSSASSVTTIQSLSEVLAQVEVNKQDLGTAVKANQAAGANGNAGAVAVAALLGESTSAASAATATSSAATKATATATKGNGRNKGGNNAAAAADTGATTTGNNGRNGRNNQKRRIAFPFFG